MKIILVALFVQVCACLQFVEAGKPNVVMLSVNLRGAAGDEPSDTIALETLFGVEALADNHAEVLRTTDSLSPEERYTALSKFVLPSPIHDSIRFSAVFLPAQHRRETGRPVDRLQSTVFALIDSAEQAGKLDELRDAVATLTFKDEVQQRQQIALLALVEIARRDFKAALPLMDQMEARYRDRAYQSLFDRWPETLLLSVAVEHPPLLEPTATFLQTIVDGHLHPPRGEGPIYWDQHIRTLAGRIKHVEQFTENDAEPATFGTTPRLANWVPVSEGDSVTYGQGFPVSHWQLYDDRIEKLSGHRDEHLYFRSPLQGDFQIECDATGFGWREGQVLLGGNWLWLQYTLREFVTGNLRGNTGMHRIDPPLTKVTETDWVHYRVTVQDGVSSTFLNGRLVRTETSQLARFPWLALRSPYWSATGFRNVRITGSPTVPDSISMTADPQLTGWVPYHRDSVNGRFGDWRHAPSPGRVGGLVARKKSEFKDMYQESLLRYHRPMLEDGAIEYDFLYLPGECDVAPALDRQAFLLSPEGVRIHEITDGVWERSGRDPLNQSEIVPDSQCPLLAGWNRLRFELTGDELTLYVNERKVATQGIPADGLRVFGLFHYSDQTRVQIRNMRWTGKWPKSIPAVEQQQLRDPQIDKIDAHTADLKDQLAFQFDTATDTKRTGPQRSYSSRFFLASSSDGKGNVQPQADGLLMRRPTSGPYAETLTVPRLQVDGDFDIVAEFSDLALGKPNNGDSTIFLTVVADDDEQTHCRLWHGLWQPSPTERHRQSQAEFNRTRSGQLDVNFGGPAPEECNSGRLRIARIGKRLHFMIAEDDSPNYRLLHSRDVFDGPLHPHNGVMLRAGTYDKGQTASGSVSVLWKSLTISADKAVLTAPL